MITYFGMTDMFPYVIYRYMQSIEQNKPRHAMYARAFVCVCVCVRECVGGLERDTK